MSNPTYEEMQELIKKLVIENKQLKDENNQLKDDKEELKRDNLLSSFISFSYANVYEEFVKDGIYAASIPDLAQVSLETISTLWKNLDVLTLTKENEEPEYQEYMDKVLAKAIATLTSPLRYCRKKTLAHPTKIPDGTFIVKNEYDCSWFNAVVMMEIEKQGQSAEGKGQVVSCLAEALRQQKVIDRTRIFGFYTDCYTIAFLGFDGENRIYSNELPFINNSKVPTPGFVTFCELLCTSLQHLGYKSIPDSVYVNDTKCHALRILGSGGDATVYECVWKGSTAAIKIPLLKSNGNRHNLKNEAGWLMRLAESQVKAFVPKLEQCAFNALVLTPVCKSLEAVLAETPTETLEMVMKGYAKQWLLALKELHKHGIVHNDLRIDNVMVNHDRIMFVDWQSASEIGSYLTSIRSANAVMPDRLIEHVCNQDSFNLLDTDPFDDLEQLLYALVYVMYKFRYPWMTLVKNNLTKLSQEVATHDFLAAIKRYRCEVIKKGLLRNYYERNFADKLATQRSTGTPDYDALAGLLN